jgi:ABC-type sugar transport system permease subunit
MKRIGIKRYNLHREMVSICLILPALIFFVLIYLIPFLQGIPISLSDWDGVSKTYNFIGLRNYGKVLTDAGFIQDTWNTLYFTIIYMIFSNLTGFIFALCVYQRSRYNSILRSIFFLPFVVALITTAFIWKYIWTDVWTPLTGLPSPLAIGSQAMLGIIINAIWRDCGYCMIIYIAALQSVPLEYYEVAIVEGASRWAKFSKVTVPLIAPAFTSNFTLLLAWGIKLFEYPMAATSGGPGRATESIAMFAYNNMFGYMAAGYGQASAILMTLMLSILSFSLTRFLRSREVEL